MAIKPSWTPLYGSQARPPYQDTTQPNQIASPWDGPAMLGACGLIPSWMERTNKKAPLIRAGLLQFYA
ncbi:hypothetical protein [uncultured Litoreibacter sp.]|uniref:hypothetical protein n=1 Tax=uncultured Litoreibacter sp. TaxID=1392394 RepID=UPI0026131CCB|nr:hypothetical protein [uncultured Litoreibacter sp.]